MLDKYVYLPIFADKQTNIMIKRIEHRGKSRLSIDFPYNENTINMIDKIPDRRWSQTKKVWHVPDNEESLKFIKEMFPEMYSEFKTEDIKTHTKTHQTKKNKEIITEENKVFIYKTQRRIVLKIKKNDKDIEFIKTLRYSNFDNNENRWLITNNEDNNNAILNYFSNRLVKFDDWSTKNAAKSIGQNSLHIVEYERGRIRIISRFNQELENLIKGFPYNSWDDVNGWWATVNTKEVVGKLEDYCLNKGIKLQFFNKSDQAIKGRIMKEQIPNYRQCPKEYIMKLKLLRYSENTIKTYSSSFEEFINYYNTKSINDINEKEIIEFIRYLVVDRGASVSSQNLAINAIKFYYEKVLGESRKFYFLDRPKREKKLPEVLSKNEVELMIQKTNNIKHRCLIMLLYSAGLRASEAINLKVHDIDLEKGLITIRRGKGKNDRISLLSKNIMIHLREYYKLYQPQNYIFIGRYNGSYSVSSILKLVKRAAKAAGIKKHVMTHTLRHSFATHLLEQGTDLRYIQDLLGHESIKATEIYTHITTKGIENIKNPMDNMEFQQ